MNIPNQRSKLKTAAIGLTTLIIVMVVVISIFVFVSNRRLDARLAAMKAQGCPMTLAQLIGPKVPDDQNGAVLYEKAFSDLNDPLLQKDLETIYYFVDPDERIKNPKLWNETRRLLPKFKSIIELIEQAQSRPKFRFSDWDKGPSVTFPRLQHQRPAATLLVANALIAAQSGNTDEAMRSIQACFKLGDDCMKEPNNLSQLVGRAVIQIASDGTLDALEYMTPNEKQVRPLYNTLYKIDINRNFKRALQGERAMTIEAVQKLHNASGRKSRSSSQATINTNPSSSTVLRKAVEFGYRKILLDYDEAYYIDVLNKEISIAHLSLREATDKKLLTDPDRVAFGAFSAKEELKTYPRHREVIDVCITHVDGTRIVASAYAYKDRFGRYPSSLAEISKHLGWKLPHDPFSGRDFVYKRQGKGFLLYSIGTDLKDDGGSPSLHRGLPGDMVWQVN